MTRIITTKTDGVTLGVLDKDLRFVPELQSVTFADVFGTPHTVYARKDGPFGTPEEIIAAHEAGTLHPYETHEQAISFSEDRGDKVTAGRLRALNAAPDDDEEKQGRGE